MRGIFLVAMGGMDRRPFQKPDSIKVIWVISNESLYGCFHGARKQGTD